LPKNKIKKHFVRQKNIAVIVQIKNIFVRRKIPIMCNKI
jgi:hypothetical protein